MIKTYIKIAWRNLRKDSVYSFINIFGLTLGLVSCLCIILFINQQLGYDKHHDDADHLYRITTKLVVNEGSEELVSSGASPAIAFGAKSALPEIVEACRVVYMMDDNGSLLKNADQNISFFEPKGYLVDSTYFNVFKYRFLEGNPSDAVKEARTIVLSKEVARKLFGQKEAVGKTVLFGNNGGEEPLRVTGVFATGEDRSHLDPHYVINMDLPGLGAFVRNNQQWATQNFVYTYFNVNEQADIPVLEKKLNILLDEKAGQTLRQLGFQKQLFLQPVTDIHLHSKGTGNQIDQVSDIGYLYLLTSLGAFIILVASINFIILSIARSNKRMREIGVRKVLGANKMELITQFLSESTILSMVATFIAMPALVLLLPYVNNLTGSHIIVSDILKPQMLLTTLGIGLFTGILSGLYPAFYLSSLQTVNTLKGTTNVKSSSGLMRKSLVVCQFIISMVLIVAVITISRQMKYTQEKDLGFDKNNRIIVELSTTEAAQRFSTLKREFSTINGINGVAGVNQDPSENVLSDWGVYLPGQDPSTLKLIKINNVSKDFFSNMDIPLVAGRPFRDNDTTFQVIVNESTLDILNVDIDNVPGQVFYGPYEDTTYAFTIVGVHKNYHFSSLKEPIGPLMSALTNTPNSITVHTDGFNTAERISSLEKSWRQILPNTPFNYSFLDDDIEQFYTLEKSQGKLSIIFTFLAILISCLGLFGLVTFTAEQRKKEIGVRKVLGASITTIVRMLSKEFFLLIAISFTIATPIAWYLMRSWLDDFVFRISLNWWMFLLAGVATLIVAIATVSAQAYRAANANPIKSLRTE